MRRRQELAVLVKEVKRLRAGLGNFPEQGEACHAVTAALELFFFFYFAVVLVGLTLISVCSWPAPTFSAVC